MDLTVVVCTLNRAAKLDAFFRSLAELDLRGLGAELILVDNGSSDGTEDALRRGAATLAFARTEVIRVLGPLSAAKNRGVQAASGEIVVFTDDDCHPDPDWLLSIRRFFQEHPEAEVVGGNVRLFDETDQDTSITLEQFVRPEMPAAEALSASIHGCNLAIRRGSLLAVGGFDERLGPGSAARASEDRDVIYRVARRSGAFHYDRTARVRHNHGRKDGSAAVTAYRLGQDAFWFKHASRLDRRAPRMAAKIARGRLDRADLSKPARALTIARILLIGFFRGGKAYRSRTTRRSPAPS